MHFRIEMRVILLRFSVIVLGLIIAVILLFFSFRETLLRSVIDRTDQHLRESRALALNVRSLGFEGIGSIRLQEILLATMDGDTLVRMDSVCLDPDWFSLLKGHLDVDRLFVKNVFLELDFSESGKRLKKIFSRKDLKSDPASSSDFGLSVSHAMDRFFEIAPRKMEIRSLKVDFRNDSSATSVAITGLVSDKDSLKGLFTENKSKSSWIFQGMFSKKDKTLSMEAFPLEKSKGLPMLQELYGIHSGYDTLKFVLSDAGYLSDVLEIKCGIELKGLHFHHPKIASDTVRLPSFLMDTRVRFTRDIIELDSCTLVQFGKIKIHPYFLFERSSTLRYQLGVSMDRMDAGDFFASLPSGLFGDVRTLKAKGDISFRMDFEMDTSRCDSLLFKCRMPVSGFEITDFGKSGLLKLDKDFIHEVYVKDKLVASFLVGPSNPDFTPLTSISPFFIDCVLGSEDSHFFEHDGFNEGAFRESIIENFRAKSFVRGGSTISMQLVKNVFLTRKKTLARKLEEALIVWLIESERLVTKERMLEVYFNIIELGPGIYGVGEASRYYFDKHPSQLGLEESLFLASILPLPRAYRIHFDEEGAMKPFMAERFRVLSEKLFKRGKITQEQFNAVKTFVRFGPRIGIGR